ncbi:HEAT repeat domain-containing protein [Actomonas aquatica]|uniref:HEAT repeat domain-containing protein n=1 Tax=Actomonas aquatica TaxID=2866162 RepID=A0ABZ1C1R2_9BACT|nr:HEAT repeat domain-containing protein [Opitutus sp. WL0086]WRQ85572.1 HEAT repeat domain-containing protein [Opitutus sp. WL0086]
MSSRRLTPFLLAVATAATTLSAAPPASPNLEFTEFAREPMVRNVVAVSVDEQGRVYATSVVRRQAADLDIRRFTEWIETDLSLTSVDAKRDFFQSQLTPANSATFAERFEDTNGDGSYDFADLNLLADTISRLEDTDGDGVADRVTKFNATENTHITGIAAGLAAWDHSLYVAVEPDLIRLTDTDGDDRPDTRDVLAHGFSNHIGYGGHNFSGATIGPDGRIYAAVADRGMNVTAFDGSRHANPHSGAIVRAELDGSGFEIYATGIRNVQEPAFDAHGNLLGVDNDGDMPGERERFVYLAEGSDTGWRTYWQYRKSNYNPWQHEGLEKPPHAGQPAYLFPPLSLYYDGPAGFAFNPGTALSPTYRDYFFLSAFPSRQLYAFQVEPDGAAFRMINSHTAASGVLMVGLAFGPDGKLYAADWSSDGYAMNENGAVWTIDDPAYADSDLRRETATLLARDWTRVSLTELPAHLAHADQRVRLKAQFELARQQADDVLLNVAVDHHQPQLARLHAIWGIGQCLRSGKWGLTPGAFSILCIDPDPEVRAQTAKILGEIKTDTRPSSTDLLHILVRDPADRPRFFAAIALGRTGRPDAVPLLLDYLRQDGADPYHRHAAVMGLAGCATPAQLATLATDADVHVRLGAVVALRRQASPLVADFLADPDPLVVAEAALAIYDDSAIPAAWPALAALLDHRERPQLERSTRRALATAQRLRDATNATRVATYATDSNQPLPLRHYALTLLQDWAEPARLDSVQGAYRALPAVDATTLATAVAPSLRTLATTPDPELARAAWDAATAFGIEPNVADLRLIVQQDTPLAADALRILTATTATNNLADLATTALDSAHPPVRAAALRALAQADPAAANHYFETHATALPAPVTRAALEVIPSTTALRDLTTALRDDTLPPDLALDVLLAAQASADATVQATLAAYQNSKDATDPLAPYRETLHGGDPAAGAEVFRTSVTAQCTLCHRVEGPGSNVGPALARIGQKRSPEYLLRALVAPGADVALGFGFTSLTLQNGEVVGGTLLAETAEAVTMKLADNTERIVPLADIAARTPLMSSMPPMGQIMTRPQLRDLLAYLQSLQ